MFKVQGDRPVMGQLAGNKEVRFRSADAGWVIVTPFNAWKISTTKILSLAFFVFVLNSCNFERPISKAGPIALDDYVMFNL